jgi:glycosyltransferase involved in cell wall biosynthesis
MCYALCDFLLNIMRILYHHRTQAEDAQGIHIEEMVKAFRDLGHEVEMVALVKKEATDLGKKNGNFWRWLKDLTPSWGYELMSLGYNLYGYQKLSKKIRSKRPDLIYERYSLNTFCGIWASKRFGIPLILEVNAPLYYEQNNLGKLTFKRLARFSERWVCSNSKRTIVVSNVMKESLEKEGVPGEKMVVMPNGIDPEKFHLKISGDAVRQRYGLNGKIVIGFVGWFRKWHGLEMLIEAFHEGNLGQNNAKLLLVGDGPAAHNLREYVQKYGLVDQVIFTGPLRRNEIPGHIAAMDITVQPSAPAYACPIKILEYMAMGKCIIAPDQPNIREILQDGINSYLFKPQDQENLREVLLKVIGNRCVRHPVEQLAYETIYKKHYLWYVNARRVVDFVSEDSASE